jgi:CRP-like cAMP-binding protein
VSVAAGEPTERVLSDVGAGTALGEVGLLTGRVRSATATALERTEALHLPREHVAALASRFPQVASRFARILSRRIVETDQALARALRGDAEALAPIAAERRAEVEHRRGLGRVLVATFREVVLQHSSELPFFFLTGFLAALVLAKSLVQIGAWAGHDPKTLFRDIYVTGLLLLLVTGGAAHFVFHRSWRRVLCAAYGAALGFLANELSVLLAFDVFYLDMTTRDPNATFSVAELYDRAATRYAVLIVVAVAIQATYLRAFYRRALFLVRERFRRGGRP